MNVTEADYEEREIFGEANRKGESEKNTGQ